MGSQNTIARHSHPQPQEMLGNPPPHNAAPLSSRNLLYGSSLLLEWIMLSNYYRPEEISIQALYLNDHPGNEMVS